MGLRADNRVVLDAPYKDAATRRARLGTIVLAPPGEGDRWWEPVWSALRGVDYHHNPAADSRAQQQQQPQVRVPVSDAAPPEPKSKARRVELSPAEVRAIEDDVSARIARADFASKLPRVRGFLQKQGPMVTAAPVVNAPSSSAAADAAAAAAEERVRAWYDAWHAAALENPAAPLLPDVYRTLYANGRRGITYEAFLRGDTGKAVVAFAKFAL